MTNEQRQAEIFSLALALSTSLFDKIPDSAKDTADKFYSDSKESDQTRWHTLQSIICSVGYISAIQKILSLDKALIDGIYSQISETQQNLGVDQDVDLVAAKLTKELLDRLSCDAERHVAYCARVSSPNQER